KVHFAHGLFQQKGPPPEIVTFLRKALEPEDSWIDFGYGPYFQAFKERVIRADELAKEPKVELVKKHVKGKFPSYGGGLDYTAASCIFAPGPVLYAARPLNNDGQRRERGQQGELFTYDLL